MLSFLKSLFFLGVAAVLTATALLVPAHLRSVDRTVLSQAAERGLSAEGAVRAQLNAAAIGPAGHLARGTGLPADTASATEARIAELRAANPVLGVTGGPAPYLEAFLELTQKDHPEAVDHRAIVRLLLSRGDRAALAKRLDDSENANLKALLRIRNLRGMVRLHPADHAAGGPYDSGVLTLALLVQGGHFDTKLAEAIGRYARAAAEENPAAVQPVERLVTATLSLGRRLDFRSLAALASTAESLDAWSEMAELFREQPATTDELFSAFVLSEAPRAVYRYLDAHPETGPRDLRQALVLGPGAVELLLSRDRPIYRPSAIAGTILDALHPYRPERFVELPLQDPEVGLWLRLGLLFGGGLALAFALGAVWRGSIPGGRAISRAHPVVFLRDGLIAVTLVLAISFFFEPGILKAADPGGEAAPRIQFAVADALQSIQSPVKAMQDLDQVTLLVLALFFIIQLVIYTFCLIKLKEIAKQLLPASTKIKLLENEENLFDFGLYVGLGGTVLSLILVAMGIVEASLMAAYASTLFGILFVALLKILHVRPYRQKLILEIDGGR